MDMRPQTHSDSTISTTRSEELVRDRGNHGIALMTTMIVLLLLSAMVVGVSWLVLDDQKLGGNNSDRQRAFYGAEAGMESLTASLENVFNANYAPDRTAINNLLTNPGPPSNIPGVQYIAAGSSSPGSGYQISFRPSASNANVPASGFGTISSGTYAGLVSQASALGANRGDSDLSVRVLFPNRSSLLRWPEFQLRGTRTHQRQPVARRRRR
ncbi:MAG: hypothetical protein DMG30_03725 [Acidobacteria bacterium]|nr:MAG: hypothetical protein DMG30_03725 [Acidobacteriota bacterium]